MRNGRHIFVLLLLCAAVLPYVNIFQNGWVYYDDVEIIRDRSYVTQPSWQGLQLILTPRGNYAPSRDLSYLLDSVLFGGRIQGYQFTNILWHAIGTVAFAAFVTRQWGKPLVGFLAGVLFAVHPLRVESVAWTVGRKDLMCFALSSLTCLAYLRAMRTNAGSAKWIGFGCVLLLGALGSKLAALGLPLVLLALEFCIPSEDSRSSTATIARRWLPFAALTALWFLMTVPAGQGLFRSIVGSGSDVVVEPGLATVGTEIAAERSALYWDSIRSMVIVTWRYIGLWLWPVSLSPLYSVALRSSWLDPAVVTGIAGLFALAGVAVVLWRRGQRKAVFWFAWTLAFYLPVSNLLPITALMQDRYVHMPSAGASVLLAAGIVGLGSTFPSRRLLGVIVGVYVVLLASLTIRQNTVWRSAETLWTHAQRIAPSNVRVAVTVASLPLLENRPSEALNQLLAIQEQAGQDYRYQLLLADAYRAAGRAGLAVEVYEQLWHRYPGDLKVSLAFGTLQATLGRYDEAYALAEHVLKLRPHSVEGHVLAGGVLARSTDPERGRAHFETAASLRPSQAGIFQEATLAMLEAAQYDDAARYGQRWFHLTMAAPAARFYVQALSRCDTKPDGYRRDVQEVHQQWPEDAELSRAAAALLEDSARRTPSLRAMLTTMLGVSRV